MNGIVKAKMLYRRMRGMNRCRFDGVMIERIVNELQSYGYMVDETRRYDKGIDRGNGIYLVRPDDRYEYEIGMWSDIDKGQRNLFERKLKMGHYRDRQKERGFGKTSWRPSGS